MAAPIRRRATTRSSAYRRGWRNKGRTSVTLAYLIKNGILFLINKKFGLGFLLGERHDAIGPDKRHFQFYTWSASRIRANRLRGLLHQLLREKRAGGRIRQRQLPDRLQSRVLLVSLRTPGPVAKTGRRQTSQAGGVLQMTGADVGGETRRLAIAFGRQARFCRANLML
jgi:hypothetical protein